MTIVISVENLSKVYRLGQIGTGTFANDLKLWWAKTRGKPNPLLRIGETDHGNRDGEDLWALRNVSFTVEQGDVLGIIGRNGAGKSTLLKILSRVTAPTSGRIKVKGRIASLLEVGTGFHPELTGRENIYLNGAILGMKRTEIDRKFDAVVDFSEVEKFIDTPVKRYSSGMYVRLAFAVAAHLESEILVVDEVLAVGDAEFQKKCLGKMGEVAREGRTVLFVSHNLNSINVLCPSAMVIDNGHCLFLGKTQQAITHYLNDKLEKKTMKSIGDDRFLLNKAYIESNNVRTDQPISLFIDFVIKKVTKNLRIGFDLLDSRGTILFRSWHDDLLNAKRNLGVGNYLYEAVIPTNLLKPDKYTISIEVGIHNVKMIISENYYIGFVVTKIGGVNKLYNDRYRPGVISPAILWKGVSGNDIYEE